MSGQRTAAWRAARLGKATASRIADIIARTRNGYAASRSNYAAQLVCECLTGLAPETFVSPAMHWGLGQEASARQFYAFEHDADVTPAGFLDHPTIAFSGATPDGFVGDEGLIEIKCPNTASHIETLLGGAPPAKYLAQMQWQMAVTGRLWCDFVSFDPRLPFELQLFVQRIRRDDRVIAALEEEVASFLDEVARTVAALDALGRPGPQRQTAGPGDAANDDDRTAAA